MRTTDIILLQKSRDGGTMKKIIIMICFSMILLVGCGEEIVHVEPTEEKIEEPLIEAMKEKFNEKGDYEETEVVPGDTKFIDVEVNIREKDPEDGKYVYSILGFANAAEKVTSKNGSNQRWRTPWVFF